MLTDGELEELLTRRPDLIAGAPPGSFAELAGRAGAPASLRAALRTLDRGALQLAELLALTGLPAGTASLAAAAGPNLPTGRRGEHLAALRRLGIVVERPGGELVGPPELAAAFDDPGELGPPVADLARVGLTREQLARILAHAGRAPRRPDLRKPELVAAAAAALTDPEVVARLLAGAGAGEQELLDRARAAGGAVTVPGSFGSGVSAEERGPIAWLVDRGLLLPAGYDRYVIPREAGIGLRGGLVFPEWPVPPPAPAPEPLAGAAEHAAAAALRLVAAAEGLLVRLDREPLPLIRSGTLAARDVRRLARELDLEPEAVAVLTDLLVETRLLAVGGSWERRTLALRPQADAWLAGPRPRRWADLAVTWRDSDLAFEDHFAGEDASRPLGGERHAAGRARRRGLVAALTGLPCGQALPEPTLAERLAWERPRDWRPPARGAGAGGLGAVLRAAALLGLAVRERGRAAAGVAAGAWVEGAGAAELAGVAAGSLPEPAGRFLVAGDLTVVAPGGLAPPVEAELALIAERESPGPATGWRLGEASLRRALDAGRTPEQILAFLRAHSDTPLPQALDYLVSDTARRHGHLRAGSAASYLRGEPAAVAATVRSAAGRKAGLRELAPGVAVSELPEDKLVAELRKGGDAPLAEAADGTPRADGHRPVRHRGRDPRPPDAERPRPDPAAAVAKLRATVSPQRPGGVEVASSPAQVAAACLVAAGERRAVEIAYRSRDGSETIRTIEPLAVRAGTVHAFCRLRQAERDFALDRIAWARHPGDGADA